MSVSIGPYYTQRILSWEEWKVEVSRRDGIYQSFEESSRYLVWFYDGPDAFISFLYKGAIPDTELSLGRTQEEIDAEREDYETNYLPNANGVLDRKAPSNKLPGVAAAKGLGGYLPNPSNNPYQPASEESVSLYVDGEGSLATRGVFLTDEGSFRNDFNQEMLAAPLAGTVSFTSGSNRIVGSGSQFLTEISKTGYIRPLSGDDNNWGKIARIVSDTIVELDSPYLSASVSDDMLLQAEGVPLIIGETPGSLLLSGGHVIATPGLLSGSGIGLWRQADYGPMNLCGWLSISQRLETQQTWFGFRDPENIITPNVFVDVIFSGSDSTKALFRTGYAGETEETLVTLPSGSTTETKLKYKIFVGPDICTLQIGKTTVAEHELHIPNPYDEMVLVGAIENLDACETNTELLVDCVLFQNFDQITTKPM